MREFSKRKKNDLKKARMIYMYIASLKTINTTGTITLNLLLLLQTLLTAILHQKHRVNVFFSALAGIS